MDYPSDVDPVPTHAPHRPDQQAATELPPAVSPEAAEEDGGDGSNVVPFGARPGVAKARPSAKTCDHSHPLGEVYQLVDKIEGVLASVTAKAETRQAALEAKAEATVAGRYFDVPAADYRALLLSVSEAYAKALDGISGADGTKTVGQRLAMMGQWDDRGRYVEAQVRAFKFLAEHVVDGKVYRLHEDEVTKYFLDPVPAFAR